MNVTAHAEKRMRKRLGLKKSCVDKSFGDALLYGRKLMEFKGGFKRYLDKGSIEHHSQPIIYNQNIYWYNQGRLITVFQVPTKYKKYL